MDKSTIIGTVTFLIGIAILSYRNLISKEVRDKIEKGVKVNTTSITIISLFLPFILGRVSMELSTELSTDNLVTLIVGLPSSIGTLTIAFLAWKGFNKVTEFYNKDIAEIPIRINQLRESINQIKNELARLGALNYESENKEIKTKVDKLEKEIQTKVDNAEGYLDDLEQLFFAENSPPSNYIKSTKNN